MGKYFTPSETDAYIFNVERKYFSMQSSIFSKNITQNETKIKTFSGDGKQRGFTNNKPTVINCKRKIFSKTKTLTFRKKQLKSKSIFLSLGSLKPN